MENLNQEVQVNVIEGNEKKDKLIKVASFAGIASAVIGLGFIGVKAYMNRNSNQEEMVEQIEQAIIADEEVAG